MYPAREYCWALLATDNMVMIRAQDSFRMGLSPIFWISSKVGSPAYSGSTLVQYIDVIGPRNSDLVRIALPVGLH